MSDAPDAAALLEERPDLRPALAAALAAEEAADGEPWTFDDIDADSGSFGELVSRGIVDSLDDGYRLAEPEAVRRALDGSTEATEPVDSATPSLPSVDFGGVEWRVVGGVGGVLALVIAFRLFSWPDVFPGEHVVLSGNDPYFYRYLVEQSVAAPDVIVAGTPDGEPLLVAILALASGALGGTTASGAVMAWYPVVAAAGGAALLYWLAVRVSRDRRVGLAAVALLAVTPGHALRTSLGFADHHALDYLFLTTTALALVWLVTRRDGEGPITLGLASVGLGVGIAGQLLAWEAGALVMVGVALAVLLQVFVDVRAEVSPLEHLGPVLAGLGLGALLVAVAYLGLGWQSAIVASSAALLFAGSIAVVIAGELAWRRDWSGRSIAALTVGAGGMTAAASWFLVPALWGRLLERLPRVTGPSGSQTAETLSLVSVGTIGSLSVLGLLLFVAVPALVWVTASLYRDVEGADRWVTPIALGWYFLVLSLFQVRFVGELAPFAALFSGLGFVWMANWVDLTDGVHPFDAGGVDWRPTLPEWRTAGALLALFLLVGGIAALQVPIKVEQTTVDAPTYRTAVQLDAFADERGWSGPDERYVFSQWGQNRVFNYFVNGQSKSYSYAWRRYDDVVSETRERAAYSEIGDRVAFVVTSDVLSAGSGTVHDRLHQHFGSATATQNGLGHFRLVYVAEGGVHAAFTPVPGATVVGSGPANATVSVETVVDAGTREVTYRRRGTTNASGQFTIRVANPGTYDVTVGQTTTTVTVSESAVHAGETVRIDGG